MLITSRRSLTRLDGAAVHRLGLFDGDEALGLLNRIVGAQRVAAEPEAAARIVAACGHLPLAVALAAARLRSRPAWSLADVAERMNRGRLDALRSSHDKLREVFGLSYRGLPDQSRETFRLSGLWPGQEIEVAQAAVLQGIPPETAEDLLESLVDASMLQSAGPGRYRLHDLMREFALEIATADQEPETTHAAVERLVSWYLYAATAAMDATFPHRRPLSIRPAPERIPPLPVFDSAVSANRWFDTHRSGLIAAAVLADDHRIDDVAWQLPVTLQPYLHSRLLVADLIGSQTRALQAADRDESPNARARVLHGLGAAYLTAGRFDDAIAIYTDLPKLYRQIGDRRSEGAALGALALTYKQKGELKQAVAVYEESIGILREIGARSDVAIFTNNLGTALKDLGDHRAAAACYQEALDLAVETGALELQPGILGSLAHLAAGQGDHEQAVAKYEQAIRGWSEIDQQGRIVEALENLARSQEALGRSDSADRSRARARDLRARLEIPPEAALSR